MADVERPEPSMMEQWILGFVSGFEAVHPNKW
jgi:hypothetical protein